MSRDSRTPHAARASACTVAIPGPACFGWLRAGGHMRSSGGGPAPGRAATAPAETTNYSGRSDLQLKGQWPSEDGYMRKDAFFCE